MLLEHCEKESVSAFHAHMQNCLRGSPRGCGFACAVRWSASGTPVFHSWAEQHPWELAGKEKTHPSYFLLTSFQLYDPWEMEPGSSVAAAVTSNLEK